MRSGNYPITQIIEALTEYNKGYSLWETAWHASARFGQEISPSTIERWLEAYADLIPYRRLRDQGRLLFSPKEIIRTQRLFHKQKYHYHRAKLALVRDSDTAFSGLAHFLESLPKAAPVGFFERGKRIRASKLASNCFSLKRLAVKSKQNTATRIATVLIPACGSNEDRHPTLQLFMLANDSTTIAVEVPVWLDDDEIASIEREYDVIIAPKQPRGSHSRAASRRRRLISGRIDMLQIRNGAVHILDYKPNVAGKKPISQLTIYALGLTRRVPGLRLRDIKCAWFNEACYNEFLPHRLLTRR